MDWTYTGTPSTVAADAVRALCGDTVQQTFSPSDSEIAYFLTLYGPLNAAAAACEQMASKLSASVDKSIGPVRLSLSQKATAYAARAHELRAQAATTGAPVGPPSIGTHRPFFHRDSLEVPRHTDTLRQQPYDGFYGWTP